LLFAIANSIPTLAPPSNPHRLATIAIPPEPLLPPWISAKYLFGATGVVSRDCSIKGLSSLRMMTNLRLKPQRGFGEAQGYFERPANLDLIEQKVLKPLQARRRNPRGTNNEFPLRFRDKPIKQFP
jgi:hypothetical protein